MVLPVECVLPILYPSSKETSALVEDVGAGEVIFGKGSFLKFVCKSSNTPSEATFAAEDCDVSLPNLIVRTSESEVKLAASFVNATGFPVEFPAGEPIIKINDTVTDLDSSRESFLGLVEFTVTVSPNERIVVEMEAGAESRFVVILRDTTAPAARVSTGDSKELRREIPAAVFLVSFSEAVLAGTDLSCGAEIPQLTGAETVATVASKSRECAEDLTNASFDDTYTITNVNSSEAFYDRSKNVLTVRGFPDPTPRVEAVRVMIRFQFEANSVEDYAGNKNSGAQLTIAARYTTPVIQPPPPPAPPPPPPSPPPEEKQIEIVNATDTAEAVGKVTTAVVVATSVSTIGGSVVAAATTTATAAAGGMSGASGVGTAAAGTNAMGGVVNILNMGQKIYLTSQLAVTAVPENYQAFAEQLKWTMFNIKAPWESDDDNREGTAGGGAEKGASTEEKREVAAVLLVGSGEVDKKIELAEAPASSSSGSETDSRFEQGADLVDQFFEGEPRKVLKRVLFWVFILYSIVVALHSLGLLLFRLLDKDLPSVLYIPRLEIYVSYWTMPAIATACAGILQGSVGDILVGSVVLVLLPGSFLALHLYIIWRYFLSKHPTEWEARVLLEREPPRSFRELSKTSGHSIRSHPLSTVFSHRSSGDAKTEILLPQGSSSHESEAENVEENIQPVPITRSPFPPKPDDPKIGPIGGGHHRVKSLVNHYESFSRTIDGSIDEISDQAAAAPPQNPPQNPPLQPSQEPPALPGEITSTDAAVNATSPPELSKTSWVAPPSEPSKKSWVAPPSEPSKKSWLVSDIPTHGGGGGGATLGQKIMRGCDVVLFWLWLGRPMEKVEWTKVDASSRVLERFGPMFEENRAIGLVMTRDASYQLNPKTGKLDRGEFQPVPEYLPLLPTCVPIRRHHLQLFTTAANFLKLVLFAVIIGAEEDDESLSQLVALIFISSAFCLFLRSARPQMARVELALAMMAEAADVVTFVLGLFLIVGPTSKHGFRKSIGLGMLWTEGVAFGLLVLEKFLAVCSTMIETLVAFRNRQKFKRSKGKTLMEALWLVITTHPENLERKFFHKWMVKSLGKGLNGRMLLGEELKYIRVGGLSKKTSLFGFPIGFSKTLTLGRTRKRSTKKPAELSIV